MYLFPVFLALVYHLHVRICCESLSPVPSLPGPSLSSSLHLQRKCLIVAAANSRPRLLFFFSSSRPRYIRPTTYSIFHAAATAATSPCHDQRNGIKPRPSLSSLLVESPNQYWRESSEGRKGGLSVLPREANISAPFPPFFLGMLYKVLLPSAPLRQPLLSFNIRCAASCVKWRVMMMLSRRKRERLQPATIPF